MKKGVQVKNKYVILVVILIVLMLFILLVNQRDRGFQSIKKLFDFVYGPLLAPGYGCVPKLTCENQNRNCGSFTDDCGNVMNCGSCSQGQCTNGHCIIGPSEPPALYECLKPCSDGSTIIGAYDHSQGHCVYDDCPGTITCPIIDCFKDLQEGCTPNPIIDDNGCTVSCGEPICVNECSDSACIWQEECKCDSGSDNPVIDDFLNAVGDVFGSIGDLVGLDLTPGKCVKKETCNPTGDCDPPEPKVYSDLDSCGDKNCDKNKLNLDSCVCEIVNGVKSCTVKKIPVDDDCGEEEVIASLPDNLNNIIKVNSCDNLCNDEDDCDGAECVDNQCKKKVDDTCEPKCSEGQSCFFGVCLYDEDFECLNEVVCITNDDCDYGEECVINQCREKVDENCGDGCDAGQQCVLGVCVYNENLQCQNEVV